MSHDYESLWLYLSYIAFKFSQPITRSASSTEQQIITCDIDLSLHRDSGYNPIPCAYQPPQAAITTTSTASTTTTSTSTTTTSTTTSTTTTTTTTTTTQAPTTTTVSTTSPAPTTTTVYPGCPIGGPFDAVKDHIDQHLRCNDVIRIVGGNDVPSTASYPWQVRLSMGCGGAIIHDEWVVTAAHCCYTNSITVYVGDLDQHATDSGEFSVRATKIIVNPDYGTETPNSDDICLIQVPSLEAAAPVDCINCYSHICLPSDDFRHGEACHVSGWGGLAEGNWNAPSNLQEVGVNLFSHQYCQDPCYVGQLIQGKVVENKEVCAGIPDLQGGQVLPGKDACQGDSGGPLTCVRNQRPVLTGLVSWGYGCARAGLPGVYVNVFHYNDWIRATTGMPPTNICIELITASAATDASARGVVGYEIMDSNGASAFKFTESYLTYDEVQSTCHESIDKVILSNNNGNGWLGTVRIYNKATGKNLGWTCRGCDADDSTSDLFFLDTTFHNSAPNICTFDCELDIIV